MHEEHSQGVFVIFGPAAKNDAEFLNGNL